MPKKIELRKIEKYFDEQIAERDAHRYSKDPQRSGLEKRLNDIHERIKKEGIQ